MLVAHHAGSAAVGILDIHLKEQLGVAELGERHRDADAGGIESGIAQDNAHRVRSFPQLLGHVETQVQHPTVVARQPRVHHVVADLAAVEVQLEEAQPADAGRRAGDLLLDLKVVAQHACRQVAVFVVGADLTPGAHAVAAEHGRRGPGRIIELGLFPAGRAVGRSPPLGVGHDHQRIALGEFDVERTDQPGGVLRRAEAVVGPHGQRVGAAVQRCRDVRVGNTVMPLACRCRLAIDQQGKSIIGRHLARRLLDLASGGNGDDAAEIAGLGRSAGCRAGLQPNPRRPASRQQLRHWFLLAVQPDPCGLPVRGLEQPHRPTCGPAPARCLPLVVPCLNLPATEHSRRQLLAGIFHLDGLLRGDLARVPQVSPILVQQVGTGSDQHAIGRLHLAALGPLEPPAKPRPCHVDSQRIDQVLATQVGGRQQIGGPSSITFQDDHPAKDDQHRYRHSVLHG